MTTDATVTLIAEHLPGPAVVHFQTEAGPMQLQLTDRSEKKRFAPGREFVLWSGAYTDEEKEQAARTLLGMIREKRRMEQLSDAALVKEVLKLDWMDEPVIEEMADRIHPGWSKEDPPPAEGPEFLRARNEALEEALKDAVSWLENLGSFEIHPPPDGLRCAVQNARTALASTESRESREVQR